MQTQTTQGNARNYRNADRCIPVTEDGRVSLHVKDYGSGKPVVLIHGWPSSAEMWEYQMEDLVNAGFRVIAYTRRGFGMSSHPWDGYDYNTLADDLAAILTEADLQDVALVGFSMGGGEVARYLSRHGASRISKAVLISSVLPYMTKTGDNPDGAPAETFEETAEQIREDRMAFLQTFGEQFFGVGLLTQPLSRPLLENFHRLTAVASPRATLECATAFSGTDFRSEMSAFTVPTLIIHGEDDKTVPIEISSDRTSKMIPGAEYIVYEGAPHGLFYTHRQKLNLDLVRFLRG